MRSHLTRNVFRRILANEPIIHRGCLHRSSRRSISSISPLRPLVSHNAPLVCPHRQQQRSLGGFNFNIFANRQEKKEADMEAGIEKMMELEKRERMQARLPPRKEIALAFRQLFESKAQKKHSMLTDTETQLALQSLRYIIQGDEARKDILPEEVVITVSGVLRSASATPGQVHMELSRLLYEGFDHPPKIRSFTFSGYIYALCHAEQTILARDLLLQYEKAFVEIAEPVPEGHDLLTNAQEEEEELDDGNVSTSDINAKREHAVKYNPTFAWRTILEGFVKEDNQEEVVRTLAMIKERNVLGRGVCRIMIDLSCKRGDAIAIKEWWRLFYRGGRDHRRGSFKLMGGRVLTKVFNWCLANDELEMGHEIVRDLMMSNPQKRIWDSVFIWAAGTKKSVDEIDRMMQVMESSNADLSSRVKPRKPDIETINGLVEFAVSINDPYMAERFIALGRDRGIHPDARTFVLQMDYRMNVKDTDGALIAYKHLQSHDTSSNEDVPTVNRLIVALCQSGRHDFETVMNVVADLSDRQAHFEADTVSALSILHLTRDEEDDVIDLLNTHAFHYSSTERSSIRNAILAFCLDSGTATARAWLGYTVLRDVFDELPRPERMQLMSAFFDHERPDMAVHVFQNMRRHTRDDTMPTIDTYVAAFMGLAKARSQDGLEVVHNQLKLDFNINPNTYLYNSLMIAYTACGKARNALAFWEDIVASREGPTYSSIHAALRACEKSPWGDVRAKKIWDLLQKRKVDLDQTLWASYVAALAGNGDVQLAINTLEEAVATGEVEADWFILGSLHDVAAGSTKQADVEAFVQERYPAEWKKLEGLGVNEEEYGVKRFRIDRRIGP